MGQMTPGFREQMKRLLGLKFAPADLTTHWEALADVPIPVLTEAVSRAQKTRVEFPSPVELRQDCDAVAHLVRVVEDEDRGEEMTVPVTLGHLPTGEPVVARRLWRFYHEACLDSGIESCWCGDHDLARKPWMTDMRCERTKPHLGHEFVRRCTCFESNPALIRQRDRQRQYAESKTTKRAS